MKEIYVVYTAQEIEKIYSKAFKVSWLQRLFNKISFQFADAKYYSAKYEDIVHIVKADNIQDMVYTSENYDCDDFAFALLGAFHRSWTTGKMAIFLTWAMTPLGGHAVVSFVDESGEIGIIEPQNDAIFSVPPNWGLMLLCG